MGNAEKQTKVTLGAKVLLRLIQKSQDMPHAESRSSYVIRETPVGNVAVSGRQRVSAVGIRQKRHHLVE
jgi:hypothetical protein